jgi:hypothetical protein
MKIGKISEFGCRIPFFLIMLIAPAFLTPFSSASDAKQAGRNKTIAEFEPAFAVRAATCITCHAKIQPSCITDFGYGNAYFFGTKTGDAKFGHFDGHVYGDFYGSEPNKTGWLTAEIAKQIIVPKAVFNFDLPAAGAKLARQFYKEPLQTKTLAEYLRALEKQKAAPATVIEKDEVYIGAPDVATLEARFEIATGSDITLKYLKAGGASPELKGIGLNPDKRFFTNTGDIVCDGDLLLHGTVFLNHATLATTNGCRIYATGPIFLQDEVIYRNLHPGADNANLQLVSAAAIFLGVGDKSCDPAFKDSPLSRRLFSGYAVTTFMTREAVKRAVAPQAIGKELYEQGKLIPSLEDAGCKNDSIGFSRLILNAPLVHNRYKGSFKGLVIAEFALFRLSKENLEFDPVFKKVPVLPRLLDPDYLEVK